MPMEISFSDQQTNQSEPKVPPPPSLEVNIRTMEEDLKTLRQSGGEVKSSGAQINIEPSSEMAAREKISITGYSGPEKPIFETAPSILPNAPAGRAPASAGPAEKAGGQTSWKKMLIVVVAAIWIIGLALVGYFVIWPLFK